jgi:16S rRNA (uracil1498-N3)-methyltransferase
VNLFYQPGIREGHLFLSPDESRHCAKVLRKKEGDSIAVTDGKGIFYDVQLTSCKTDKCDFLILRETPEEKKQHRIHLAISPTKNSDRIEWCVEKAVEIGVDVITFLNCSRTERPSLKAERIERVAVSAMKQSWRASLPKIVPLTPLPEFLNRMSEKDRFIAHAHPDYPTHLIHLAKPGHPTCVLVGPEGDFTKDEIDMAVKAGFSIASLGRHRLRTESAGVAAVHILNLINL